MPTFDPPPPGSMDPAARLAGLRDHLDALIRRLDADGAQEVRRRFTILAEEVRSEVPLVDVARAAGTGLMLQAAPWPDLGAAVATSVAELLTSVEPREPEEAAVLSSADDDYEASAEEETAAGPLDVGGPIYGGDDDD